MEAMKSDTANRFTESSVVPHPSHKFAMGDEISHDGVKINTFFTAAAGVSISNDSIGEKNSTAKALYETSKDIRAVTPYKYDRSRTAKKSWSNIIQSWVGYITAVDYEAGEFTAIIKDKTNRNNPDEEVVIEIQSLPPGDRTLVESGAVFYWNIGNTTINKQGTLKNAADLRMRRLPGLSKTQLRHAEEFGKRLASKINAD